MTSPQQYSPSLYQAPQQVSRVALVSATTHAPADPLEQRIVDLLYPYRDECFEDEDTTNASKERMVLVLSENIAFLIRHNQASYGKQIEINDVSIGSRNWHRMRQSLKKDVGPAYVGIFVNGGNGFTHTVTRVRVNKNDDVMERFTEVVDRLMLTFFP